jgi:hypothetical protein
MAAAAACVAVERRAAELQVHIAPRKLVFLGPAAPDRVVLPAEHLVQEEAADKAVLRAAEWAWAIAAALVKLLTPFSALALPEADCLPH